MGKLAKEASPGTGAKEPRVRPFLLRGPLSPCSGADRSGIVLPIAHAMGYVLTPLSGLDS